MRMEIVSGAAAVAGGASIKRLSTNAFTPAGLKRYQNLASTWVTLARAIQSVIKQDISPAFQSFIMGGKHAAV